MESTICAISTNLGTTGAISIIRVSGVEAIEKVNSIFKGKDLLKVASHTIHYGFIMNKEEVIDEVLVTIMRAPKTYTTEDVVEINCHGGSATTKRIFELLLSIGIEEAEAGEFTKRAFLNGRIDLIKSESIMDLINAETENERKLAINGVTGNVTKMIEDLRDEIVTTIANIEVNIDYPEYDDVEVITEETLIPKLKKVQTELTKIIHESENGTMIKSGIEVALVGRPNVGKSSILNHLLNEEKAIVTNISGTTRDIVEGTIILDGIKINLTDTAGIRETEDIIEKIGIQKSKEKIESSDFIIFVLNQNDDLTEEDKSLYEIIKNKKHVIFLNKSDLEKKIEMNQFNSEVIIGNTVDVNGLQILKDKISKEFSLSDFNNKNHLLLSNSRQINLAKESLNNIKIALEELEMGTPLDFITLEIKTAWENLGKIIGQVYEEEFLDQLFSKFCLGK